MKKITDQLPLVFLIILPLVIVFALDLTPYSKSINSLWNSLHTFSLNSKNEEWLRSANTILSYQPWQVALWNQLAQKEFELENHAEVIRSYNTMLMYQPLTVEQSILLSQSYLATGMVEKSDEIWDEIINDPDVKPEQLEIIYQIQQRAGDWLGAYRTIDRWHEVEPNQAEVQHQLVLSQIMFEPEKAMESINDFGLSEFQPILVDLETILDSDNPTYQMVIAGNIFSRLDEWEYAVQVFSKVVELDPNYAEGWAFYGNALMNTGENGFFALDKAINLSPSSKISKAYLAAYWRDQNDLAKSIELYYDLINEEGDEPVWYQELGNTYILNGDTEKALAAFQKTTELAPTNIFYWINLAKFSGDFRLEIQMIGIPAARQAMLIDNENWEVFDVLGWLYLLEKDYTSAERFLSNAFGIAPEKAVVNLHLGQLYSLQNRDELANYYLERCINHADDPELIELAKKFLSPSK
jgi:tetratricopeptide (TPR) repeat protein